MPHLLLSENMPGQRNCEKSILQAARRPIKTMAYIPTQSEKDRRWYKEICAQFKGLIPEEILFCDLDKEYDEEIFIKALESDMIYLAGGSTAALLNSLQKRELLFELQDYAERDGIFIGESAGAIIMGENIDIALEFESEQREMTKLADTSALGIYDFEFLPHFDGAAKTIERLIARSKKLGQAIVACPDGSGVILELEGARSVGNVTVVSGDKVTLCRDAKLESKE